MSHPEEYLALIELIEVNKGGSPTDADIFWIHLKPRELAELLEKEKSFKVSVGFVKRVLQKHGYKYHKLSKNLATGVYAERATQFKIIFDLVAMMSLGTPIISINCKKKENLGTLYRSGKLYSTAPLEVFDHDYTSLSEGKVIPHGIFDIQLNQGYISIGNSYRHHAFKKQLLILADLTGIDFIVCHYPPYASKWNPIEHRLFAHVYTKRQSKWIFEMCKKQSFLQAAGLLDMCHKTVERLFYSTAKQVINLPERYAKVRKLGIDEIAHRKGKKDYACVLTDLERGTQLDVLRDRKKETLLALFQSLGDDFCQQIQVVSCDIWKT